jgi:dihydroorotate dehydrogenase subfamily 2
MMRLVMKRDRQKIVSKLYGSIAKPILFSLEPEKAHNTISALGELIARTPIKEAMKNIIAVKDESLHRELWGIKFENPVGLAAGFDYNGRMADLMPAVGFGFNTVGTVTAQPYAGNPTPRLTRLTKSSAILVNKGFKSEGAVAVAKRLDCKKLTEGVLGISIGNSNVPEINSISKAIHDYLTTFSVFYKKPYIKYFELNISCPNTSLTESFLRPTNFSLLLKELTRLNISKPILIKMPCDILMEHTDQLIEIALKENYNKFIFSNLLKNRSKANLSTEEEALIKDLQGNISGRPTFQSSNKLIKHARKKYGQDIYIVGCGGIFSAHDAYLKMKLGANLVQLITGLIFQGPQLIGEINGQLTTLFHRDKFAKKNKSTC